MSTSDIILSSAVCLFFIQRNLYLVCQFWIDLSPHRFQYIKKGIDKLLLPHICLGVLMRFSFFFIHFLKRNAYMISNIKANNFQLLRFLVIQTSHFINVMQRGNMTGSQVSILSTTVYLHKVSLDVSLF